MKNLVRATAGNLRRGTQVVYVPSHLIEDGIVVTDEFVKKHETDHTGTQMGFVTSTKPEVNTAYVRYYYSKNLAGGTLRTKMNSEGTPFEYLYLFNHRNQEMIEQALERWC